MRWFNWRKRESRKTDRAKSYCRSQFRRLLVEQCEDRRLMAVVAHNDHFEMPINPGQFYSQGVELNDSSDGQPLTAWVTGWPQHGSLEFNGDNSGWGDFYYYPDSDYRGTDSFTYHLTDWNTSSDATVFLTVDGRPTGNGESLYTDVNTPLSADSASGLLANDWDPDYGDSLTAQLSSFPLHGSVSISLDGSLTYTPNTGFEGADSFNYVVGDGLLLTLATAWIQVGHTPSATDDFYPAPVNGSLSTSAVDGVLANDTTGDGGSLSASLVSGPSHGSLTLHSDGSFDYTPDADFHDFDYFTYLASDGLASVTAAVTLAVDTAPLSNDKGVYEMVHDSELDVGPYDDNVLNGAFDADYDSISAVLVNTTAHGSLTLNSDGSFSYIPDYGFYGVDSFTFQVSDGLLSSDPHSATIFVNAAANDDYAVEVDDTLSIDAGGGVLANDANSGSGLTAYYHDGPSHGSLTLNSDGSFSYTPDSGYAGPDSFGYFANDGTTGGYAVATIHVDHRPVLDEAVAYFGAANSTITGASPLLDAVDLDGDWLWPQLLSSPSVGTFNYNWWDASFSYVPPTGFSGIVSYSFRAWDGYLFSNTETVDIVVTPLATNDSYVVAENTTLNVSAAGVLGNDVGNSLTTVLSSSPAHGSLTLNANGSFSYTPTANYYGTDSFTYFARDGAGTQGNYPGMPAVVTIRVDSPPVVDEGKANFLDANTTFSGGSVILDAIDAEGDPLTAVLVSGPSNGDFTLNSDGTYTYTPETGFSGTVTISYQASDGMFLSNVGLLFLEVNPVATDDSFTVGKNGTAYIDGSGVLANDIGIGLTADLETGVAHGSVTLNSDGTFSYTPTTGFYGTDSFSYMIHDAEGNPGNYPNIPAVVTLTVLNDTAPFTVDGGINLDANTSSGDYTLIGAGNYNDPDGDPMTAILVSSTTHGTLTFGSDGVFSYTPDTGYSGLDSFTYKLSDGQLLSGLGTLSIEVDPVANADTYVMAKNTTLNAAASGVLANDIGLSLVTTFYYNGPAHGTLTLNANGSFSYTPSAGYVGNDSFTYEIHDATGYLHDSATVSISVLDDSAPIADDGGIYLDANTTSIEYTVIGSSNDPDGDPLTAILISSTSNGSLSFASNGVFSYTPNSGFSGVDTFTYQLSDGLLLSNVATISIEVDPVANGDSYILGKDTTLSVDPAGVLANDVGTSLTVWFVTAGPAHGALTMNSDGSFSYTPDSGYVGDDSFSYQLLDSASLHDTATVNITVADDTAPVVDEAVAAFMDANGSYSGASVILDATDAENDPLTAVLVSGPASGDLTFNSDGSFSYVPATGFSGVVSFTYRASDGTLLSNLGTVSIYVNPVANDDSYSIDPYSTLNVDATSGVLANDVGDSLTTELVDGPSYGYLTLNSDGSFSYTSYGWYYGYDTFTYLVHDASGNTGNYFNTPATVTIWVGW